MKFVYKCLLMAVPPILIAIAIVQVKSPIITIPSWEAALADHNTDLAEKLTEKPYNSSISMEEALENLRVELKGNQTGEKYDIAMVLNVVFGIGDPNLPANVALLPILLVTHAVLAVLAVILGLAVLDNLNQWMSKISEPEEMHDFVTTDMDTILQKRKADNPHRPVEMTSQRLAFDTTSRMSAETAMPLNPITPSLLPILILALVITAVATIQQIFQGGSMATKIFGMLRRVASIAPIATETVLDHIILVLNFPMQVLFYVALARFTAAFNGLFYHLFGKNDPEKLLLLTNDS